MANQTENQERITISAPVTLELNQRLRYAVVERRLPSKAEAIRQALEQWLANGLCPQCEAPLVPHPDATTIGVNWCPQCEEPVGATTIFVEPGPGDCERM